MDNVIFASVVAAIVATLTYLRRSRKDGDDDE